MIRHATADDVPAIMPLLLEFAATLSDDFPKPDRAKIYRELIVTLERGIVIVAERGREVVGVLGLSPGEFVFSSERVLLDRSFYVRPDHAGEGARLLAGARAIGKSIGLPVYVTRFNRATVRL